jgi:hypothetical protein
VLIKITNRHILKRDSINVVGPEPEGDCRIGHTRPLDNNGIAIARGAFDGDVGDVLRQVQSTVKVVRAVGQQDCIVGC